MTFDNYIDSLPSYIGMGKTCDFCKKVFNLGDRVVAIQRGVLTQEEGSVQFVIHEQADTTEVTDYHEQCYSTLYGV